jgi:hypothetical protein
MGANGIILQNFSEPGVSSRVASALVGIPSFSKGDVLAIHFTREHSGPNPEPNATEEPSRPPNSDTGAEQ